MCMALVGYDILARWTTWRGVDGALAITAGCQYRPRQFTAQQRTSALCCRTQGRLQERTAHRGHWYLEGHAVQISHTGTGLAAAAGGEGGAAEAVMGTSMR